MAWTLSFMVRMAWMSTLKFEEVELCHTQNTLAGVDLEATVIKPRENLADGDDPGVSFYWASDQNIVQVGAHKR